MAGERGMMYSMDDEVVAEGMYPGSASSSVVLQRDNLKDQIAQAIRTEILTGRMSPGTLYKAGEIAETYGASRTPVREAILELESKGLVEVTRGVGFRVVTPSTQELRDVLAVREMLEVPATAAVAGTLSAASMAVARRLLDELRQAAIRNDLVEYLARDKTFHMFLVAQGGNARLTQIVSELRDVQRVPGLTRIADSGQLIERHREHERILDAIEAGRADEVTTLMKHHLELSRQVLPDAPPYVDAPPVGSIPSVS